MDPRSSSRRGPIPRPWLSEHPHYTPPSRMPTDYRYSTAMAYPPVDLLRKQEWKVSWAKLPCCFCWRTQDQNRQYGGGNDRNKRHHNDFAPFPAFPILRRNSSSSLISNPNDVYPSSGSVSSFTESDTSHSDSEIIVVRNETFDSEELRRPASPPRASTPPPAPVTAKPPAITQRSRSTGLPPINPNSNASWTTPRPRFDTGDYTGIHSGTTNTSRHRRLQQFEFSPKSMERIWQGKSIDDKVVLPSYVLCQPETNRLHDSGYISALDDSDDYAPGEKYYDGDNDDEDYSPYVQAHQRKSATEEKRRKAPRPPKASKRSNRRGQRPPPKLPPASESTMTPVYLRKNPTLDQATEGSLIVSGWVAASLDNSLEDRLRYGTKGIEAKEILYLRILDAPNGAVILLHSSSGEIQHELPLQRDWICESREISSRVGRCVSIRFRNTTSPIANFLPVSLDDSFFRGDDLISEPQFRKAQDRLFAGGKGAKGNGKVYAPDEQLDAAMFILFSLDALIKNCL